MLLDNQPNAHKFSKETDDIINNLFKICSAILNLKQNQRGAVLDDGLLTSYLAYIDNNKTLTDTDTVTIIIKGPVPGVPHHGGLLNLLVFKLLKWIVISPMKDNSISS